jgi:peroxiredoxin
MLAILVGSCSSAGVLTTGSKAPDFTLSNINGEQVKLSDYDGKPVAINFWGTDCAYCVEEMPTLQQASQEESSKTNGVAIITVNVQDSISGTKNYFNQNDYTLPALVDINGKVAQAYGVSAIPVTFLIDRNGYIIYVKRGMFLSINELHVALNKIR